MKNRMITLSIVVASIFICSPRAANACGLFGTCKASAHKMQNVKPQAKQNTDVLDLKARVAKLEEGERSYIKTIAIMHQHIAMLQAQINHLRQAKEAAKN